MGLQQDYVKGNELLLRAGELGYALAHCNVGYAYEYGEGVERDTNKAKYYYELVAAMAGNAAAMGGEVIARHNLGAKEEDTGNFDRAMKNFMISARAGLDETLTNIRECYLDGHATKDDFERALRAHKETKDERKSVQREAASAARAAGQYI